MNEINDKIFWNYFKYQTLSIQRFQYPTFSLKDLIRVKKVKNEQLVNNMNEELIDLRNTLIKKEIPENENLNKIADIVEKTIDFNKQQKCKGIKMVIVHQMFQGLLIALARVKAGNISENVLNEIRKIVYYLYRAKEITNLYNEFNKVIKKNGYYIYEFWK